MKNIEKAFCFGLLLLALFTFISCDSLFGKKDNPDNTSGNDNSDFIKRLDNFGVNVNKYKENRPDTAADWEPLEGAYEIPALSGASSIYDENVNSDTGSMGILSGSAASLFSRMKMSEIYVCGSGDVNQYDGVFNFEGNKITQVASFAKSDYIASTSVRTKALDLNGDAYEDIVIASFDRTNNTITLYARLYNPEKGKYLAEQSLWTETNEHVGAVGGSTSDQGFDCFDFMIGDFDGDNKKEFAVSLSYDVNQYGKADIYIIDDYSSSHDTLCAYSETDAFSKIKENKSNKVFKFASADLNGDGYDEIYGAIGANCEGRQGYYKVYTYDTSTHSLKSEVCEALDVGNAEYNSLCSAMVDIGDVDGDGEMEVVFEGRQKEYSNCKCLILGYDKAQKKYVWETASSAKYDGDNFESKEKPYMPMAIGDIDKDGIEEIILDKVVIKFNNDSEVIKKVLPCEAGNAGICVGDFNYDGQNEIAQVNWAGTQLFITSYDKNTKSFASESFEIGKASKENNSPVSICPVASKKGVARFTFEKHYLQFTEPDVIALVAAPLYFSEKYNGGIDPEEFQPSFGNQGTSIGNSTTSSSSKDGSFSVSTSTSGGFCAKDPIGLTGIQVKIGIALEKTYEHTWGESESEEFEVSYCTHEKDMVVVKVTPMDVYVYEITHMPGAPECVGDKYYISVPRQSYVKVCDVDFYESHKSDDAPSVKALFTHTPGNPFSYDTYDKAMVKINDPATTACENSEDNEISGGDKTYFIIKEDKMETLPQGNVETTMSFSKNKENYEGDGFNIAAGIEAEAEAEGAYTSWGITFAGGDTWTTSVGSGTTIEGTVVGVDAQYADEYSFKWAIISYPVAVGGKYLAPMVTYVVEK